MISLRDNNSSMTGCIVPENLTFVRELLTNLFAACGIMVFQTEIT